MPLDGPSYLVGRTDERYYKKENRVLTIDACGQALMLDLARLLRASALRGSTQLFLVNNFLATIETFYVCGYAVLG